MRQLRNVPTSKIIPTIHKRSHIETLDHWNCFALTSFLGSFWKFPHLYLDGAESVVGSVVLGTEAPEKIFFSCIQLALAS